jgi:transglutaminase-like putative cysteine protease
MKIERLLQWNIAGLTVVGTLLLGLGQDNPMLPVLSLFAAVTSIYFTDTLGWFRLHRVVANLAALGALFISMREFDVFGGNSGTQLRAIANLLVYLQFVLLYQQKNQRVYWQLAVLSLLQVVVAAALDLQVGLGLLLVIYMLTALSAMSLLFIYSQIEAAERAPVDAAEVDWGLPLVWSPTAPPQTLRTWSRTEIQRGLLGWGFLRRLAGIGVATWILALVAFFATPRLGNAVWRGPQHGGARSVGFSREIRLGQMGEILKSEAPAMRLKLTDEAGGRVQLENAPYIRGVVLSAYWSEGAQSRWTQPEQLRLRELPDLERPPADAPLTKTEFWLEESTSRTLFHLGPSYRAPETSLELAYDLLEERLVQRRRNPFVEYANPARYAVVATGVEGVRQNEFWPRRVGRDGPDILRGRQELQDLLSWDHFQFPRTAVIAERIAEESGVTASSDPYTLAKALEGYFHRPGLFTYTLNPQGIPPRPEDVDPVEHFMAAHRTGHCEYFASALAIMLRSQGIPARIVVGYHGGEYNRLGQFYQVRQADAHAWVEAYVESRHVPSAYRRQLRGAQGGWLRLDPTPAISEAAAGGVLGRAADVTNYLELLWNDYVLGLNSDKQARSIYGPVTTRVRQMIEEGKNQWQLARARWSDLQIRWRGWVRSLGLDSPDAKFPWRTTLTGLLLATLFAMLARAAWRWLRLHAFGWRWTRSARRRADLPGLAPVAFYRRFEKMLARRKLRRERRQTQREFARQAAREISRWSGRHPAPLLDSVVEAYYRVRFGKHPLDSQEAAAIENTLDQLEQTLAQSRS